MRGLAGLLVLVGVIFGPVYLLTWERVSGLDGPSFELSERGQRWTLVDGTILHFAKGQAYRPLDLELDPKMNRIGFRLTFEAGTAANNAAPGADRYEVTLMQGDQSIFRHSLELHAKANDAATLDGGGLEVFFPGTYTFILEGPEAPRAPITRVRLLVREQVQAPTMAVVWVGLAGLVVGLAMLIEPYLPRSRHRA
ncbi:MAG: hypothetical protein C5B46_07440 [Proteobacteria bacterium]|nr:MAG: hypothetical protein C5B46_07440 [Pseudomonadota bacterium]